MQFNPSSAKFIKWSNTLKQFVFKLPTNCLSVFDHFEGLTLKGLNIRNNKCLYGLYEKGNSFHLIPLPATPNLISVATPLLSRASLLPKPCHDKLKYV